MATPTETTPRETAQTAAAAATPSSGLSEEEVLRLREQYGPNTIEEKHESALRKLARFFWGPIPWMIEAAAVLSAIVRHWEDLAIITSMLLINAAVGFWEEHKADNAIVALKRRLAPRARVRRDGQWRDVDAAELVPGDLVVVRLGNIVPADLKLSGEGAMEVDQSALTGESLPVSKGSGEDAYSGTIVRTGEMTGVVTATGAETYFGRTARLVETAGARSHFQRAVLQIGNFLIAVTLGLVLVIVLVAMFRREPLAETLMFALILTVAAIPVALPAVLSVTMAAGANRLAGMQAIVSRLVSIEELAGLDVLCCDKTGTLTRNQLTVGEPVLVQVRDPGEVLLWGSLASRESGDAIDAAVRGALPAPERLDDYELLHFTPFDPVHKRTVAELRRGGASFTVTKGAPQVVLALCALPAELARAVTEKIEALAGKGYRTLGVARREGAGPWLFLGLLPLFDPPREDAAATLAELATMGLSVRMITGDNVAIAREVARKLGLAGEIARATEIFTEDGRAPTGEVIERAVGFAEVFPEHKLALVRELQGKGHIVGMTGDGVNDAPALEQADAGIAVSGATDAARASADLVLTAPGLSVIGRAVEEARRIFERMTSYATFRIAETVRVLLFMSLSIVVFGFYPVTAIMIVLLALLNDFPIMMIAYDNARVAEKPVRWEMRRVLSLSAALGTTGVASSFTAFWVVHELLRLPEDMVRSLLFLKLLVAGHLTIFVTRNDGALWQRPWPAWKLVAATEATQVLGTIVVVYGWLMEPIGWAWAGAIWAYCLVWLGINSAVKLAVLRLLDRGTASHGRHLHRISKRLHSHARP